MRQFKILATALGAALLVAGCGGGGDGNQAPAISYTAVVSFGDSLSDAGSYGPGLIASTRLTSAAGGGMFNINGIAGAVGTNPTPSYNWAQLVSAAATGKVNCAARAGGYLLVESKVAGCTNYAQGGARVTAATGTGNTGMTGTAFTKAMTEPVVTQVANYLVDASNAGKFTGKELVTVLAGANDIFGQTAILTQGVIGEAAKALVTSLVTQFVAGLAPANQATAAPAITTAATNAVGAAIATESAKPTATLTSIITAATGAGTQAAAGAAMADATTYTNANLANAATTIPANAGAAASVAAGTYAAGAGATAAVTGMLTAATELATSIKGMVTNGAKHIVVVNIPDVSQTPYAMGTIVYNTDGTIKDNSTQKLVWNMTTAFNQKLAAELGATPDVATSGILLVDAFSENQRQIANPAHYALSNVKDVACDATKTPVNLSDPYSASSLVCTTSTLVTKDSAGKAVTQDQVLHFLFADSVHPTPFGYKLLAQYVTQKMVLAGRL